MARIRSIKPEAFTSETLARLPVAIRWTFAGLWTYVDDYGRGRDNPKLIKAAIWPLDDDVTSEDVEHHLEQLAAHGLICRYGDEGQRALHVVNFTEHQRPAHPTPSKLPECSRDSHEASGKFHEASGKIPPVVVKGSSKGVRGEGGSGGEGSPNGEVAQGARPKRGTRIPEPFPVTDGMKAWVEQQCPDIDARVEHQKFVRYWRGKTGSGATKLDWKATWEMWMLNARDRYGGNRRPSRADDHSPDTPESLRS